MMVIVMRACDFRGLGAESASRLSSQVQRATYCWATRNRKLQARALWDTGGFLRIMIVLWIKLVPCSKRACFPETYHGGW